MSEAAKAARKAMRDKAERLTTADPHQKVDASDWTPAEALKTTAKTGMRPVSPRQFKRGGKVEGDHARQRADRMMRKGRKDGGMLTVDKLENRDLKDANQMRAGEKHIGGMKKGGRAKSSHHEKDGRSHKMDGGSFVPTSRMGFEAVPSRMSRAAGLKSGGMAHGDEAEDKKLVRAMVKPSAIKKAGGGLLGVAADDVGLGKLLGKKRGGEVHGKECRCHECMGGMKVKGGGSVSDGKLQGTRPTGGRLARKHGGKADAHWIAGAIKHPGALHKELGVPEGKKIPAKKLEKAEHSSNKLVAKRAHLAETLRGMGRSERASGGRAGKGKMNVNIIIGTPHAQEAQPMGMNPSGGLPPRPMPVPPPAMPPGMPPGGAGAAPPAMPVPMPPMGGGGMGGGMPPMPRKSGGRTYRSYKDMDAGAGSGKGRLEKEEIQSHRR